MSYIRSDDFAPEGRPFCTYFRKMYVGCECHLAKPDPAIYRYVLNDAHLQSSESILWMIASPIWKGCPSGTCHFSGKNGESGYPNLNSV